MADQRKPAPPSFYSKMADMSPAPAAAPPAPTPGQGEGANPAEIVATLTQVFEKWRKLDAQAQPFIDRMADVLKEYETTILSKGKKPAGKEAATEPVPAGV